jgi:molybdenum cofactor biosynthesis enzyme MoaA
MPQDRFGRTIDYLRMSVIDHCNLRCVYCMPLSGLRFAKSNELLSVAEMPAASGARCTASYTGCRASAQAESRHYKPAEGPRA